MARDFDRWLKQRLNITFTQYLNLTNEERELLRDDYKECRIREAKKAFEEDETSEKQLSKYLEKLRLRKQRKIDEFGRID